VVGKSAGVFQLRRAQTGTANRQKGGYSSYTRRCAAAASSASTTRPATAGWPPCTTSAPTRSMPGWPAAWSCSWEAHPRIEAAAPCRSQADRGKAW